MSVVGSQRSAFGDETGADGRALTDTDLNSIGVNATRRAWEVPGYAHLLGHDEISSSGAVDYSDVFAGTGSRLLDYGVFTIGRGLEVSSSGLGTSVGAGFLGIWRDPDGPAPPPTSGDNRMYWVSVADGDIAVTHTAAASGKQRWDLVCVTPSEVNGDSATRHFQDAVTGVVTSEVVVVGRKPTITVSVVSGTEDNPGSANMPYLVDLSGEHVVYAVLVSDTAVVSVYDFTVPVGTIKSGLVLGREGTSFGAAAWAPQEDNLGIASEVSVGGDLLIFPPVSVRGSVDGLLLGIKIVHKLYSGCSVYISALPTGAAGGSLVNLVTLTASITMDGTDRSKMLDLRGIPASENTPPLWLNGTNKKGQTDYALCLRVTAASTTNVSVIRNVQWYTL